MKRTAFIQALLIVLLLTASWILLIQRWQRDPSPPDREESPAGAPAGAPADRPAQQDGEAPARKQAPAPETSAPAIPETWSEWVGYLEAADSPDAMRAALEELRNAVFSMQPGAATAWLLSLIRSGYDLRTGLAFQTGPDRSLRGAASLRAMLLDWLHKLDPQQAAQLALDELDRLGTRLVPDVYVIHMRNYGALESASADRLNAYFRQAITHGPWLQDPPAALAEAMDVPVYTGATGFVPDLSRLLQPDKPRMLRHAASLALERMVEQAPVEALEQLLPETAFPTPMKQARAGYFARLDPGIPEADRILDAYMAAPGVTREEAALFLRSFPNLNQSFSHSLLSTGIPDTQPGNHMRRLQNALAKIREWRGTPETAGLEPVLDEVEARLAWQVEGTPPP